VNGARFFESHPDRTDFTTIDLLIITDPYCTVFIMQKVSHLLGKAFRETGQAMDRLGLTIAGSETFRDHLSRHRPVMGLFDKVCVPFFEP